jgi:uncharacterized protein YecT (DUF1311 family)
MTAECGEPRDNFARQTIESFANEGRALKRLMTITALVIAFGASPVRADGPNPKDVTAINACLTALDKRSSAGQEIYEAKCLLKVADPCIGGDDGSVRDRRKIECFDREQRVWDKIINDSYKTVMNRLEPEQAEKLRDMQRAWIHVRDLTCTFWYDYFQGTMANPMIASCQNREAARRAIYLRTFAIDMVQRK